MNINAFILAIVAAALPLAFSAPAGAALSPVFSYQFPASVPSGVSLTSNPALNDQSAAGNNATAVWFAATADTTAAPTGQSGNALTWTTSTAGKVPAILTNGTTPTLLSVDKIAAAAGFTIDTWFNTTNLSATQKIVNRGDADSLELIASALTFNFAGATKNLSTTVVKNTWYHVVAAFDTTGNSATPDSTYKTDRVTGTAVLTVNDVLVGTMTNVTLSGLGDASKYALSIGRDANDTLNPFYGSIYNPAVYLGTTLPEPVGMAVMSLATMACFRRVRR